MVDLEPRDKQSDQGYEAGSEEDVANLIGGLNGDDEALGRIMAGNELIIVEATESEKTIADPGAKVQVKKRQNH